MECELVNNRVVAAPLETRGALGAFDAVSGRLHLTASAAGAHSIRDLLANGVFRIPRENLRVSIPDVGGGFGMKNVLYPEYVLVLWAARRLGRPVQWIGDRSEDFVASAHGRDSIARARLALDRDGRFLALETKLLANLGAYVSTVAPVVPTMAMASAMGGVYDIPLIAFQASGVFTNTTPVDAYRGAGKPEANYLIERCIDIAAAGLGMDALKLRRKNILRRFPYRSAMGLSIEQGSFAHAIDRAVKAASGFKARRKSSRKRGRLRGLGYACFLETARGTPNEVAEVGSRRTAGSTSRSAPIPTARAMRPPMPRSRPTRSACRPSASGFGRATPMISTAVAGMAGRARCTRAAPRCCSRQKA